ncbi:MAG: hypothetical protein WCF12_12080 [Propionicimonas sp.]
MDGRERPAVVSAGLNRFSLGFEDRLVELALEREDRDELARLAAAGNSHAAAILDELEW